MEEKLAKIIDFGDIAHGEQKRKYVPDRYMVHPVRVMRICQNYTDDIAVLAAALLHDVLEDTPVTEEEIKTFLEETIGEEAAEKSLELVVDLTDVYTKEAHPHLNRRSRKEKEVQRLSQIQPESQMIKYADIIDNTSEIVEYDLSFARVYLTEALAILKKMDAGQPELYQIAVKTVEDRLKQLKLR